MVPRHSDGRRGPFVRFQGPRENETGEEEISRMKSTCSGCKSFLHRSNFGGNSTATNSLGSSPHVHQSSFTSRRPQITSVASFCGTAGPRPLLTPCGLDVIAVMGLHLHTSLQQSSSYMCKNHLYIPYVDFPVLCSLLSCLCSY